MTEKQASKAFSPPHSKESEMMVLGCMLTSASALSIGSELIGESDFYLMEHQVIFAALKEAFTSEKPADIHLISEKLKMRDKLDMVGGVAYLTTLAQYAGTSAYIEEYIEIVRNKSILRRMIESAKQIEKSALLEPEDVYTALDEAQGKFFQISQSSNQRIGVSVKDLLSGLKASSNLPFLKELQGRQEEFLKRDPNLPPVTGIPSGFIDLDKLLGGFNKSNLIILAARPSMGKTALLLNAAAHASFDLDVPVGFFSLEMTAEEILQRLICTHSEIETDKIKTGSLNGLEYQKIVSSVNKLLKHTFVIDDQPGMKITDLRARARRLKEVYDIQLLVIDYLQLLSGSRGYYNVENRQNEISEISRMLKNLARELEIPIICGSQLSRKVEERAGHRPMLSDIRESGCLAGDTLIQDAVTGQLHNMKELADRKIQTPLTVNALGEDLKIGKYTMTKVFYSGRKTLYKLTLRSGRTIKASANHPFRKLDTWTALENLQVGDRLAIPRALPSTNTSTLTNDELTYLAHLLGDGCILPKQPYHYTSADEINIDTVNRSAYSLFGIQSRVVKQKNWYHSYFPSPYRLTHNRQHPITTCFNTLEIERVRAPEKGKSPEAAIYYASSSHTLSSQVQQLLLRLGISSTLYSSTSKQGYRTMYHVNVQGCRHQIQFLTRVGSAGKRGEVVPYLLGQFSQINENPNIETIPEEAWKLFVRPAKDEAKLGWREVSDKLGMPYCGSTLFKSSISRNRMARLAEICHSKQLFYLAESDVYWDEILSIETLGEEDVYDATVPGVHNFVANDIIVHNSIEQDADIVMFLFRRDYYNPNDKPGMAEVLIAKNRHGSIGNVELAFRKKFAQFHNYDRNQDTPPGKDNSAAFSAFSPAH